MLVHDMSVEAADGMWKNTTWRHLSRRQAKIRAGARFIAPS